MKDLVIIDCWSTRADPDQSDSLRLERIQNYYDRLCLSIIKTQALYRRIYIASYEDQLTDPKILALSRRLTRISVEETLTPRLIQDVEVCGRSFGRCVHGRPLGIIQLMEQGHRLWVDPKKCTQWSDDQEHQMLREPQDGLPWQSKDQSYCLDLDPQSQRYWARTWRG